jgi:acetyl-CoA carboxylase carboxyltransferase component
LHRVGGDFHRDIRREAEGARQGQADRPRAHLCAVGLRSFVELDALATHRSGNFGLAENRPLGDGVVTGYGTIDGHDGRFADRSR